MARISSGTMTVGIFAVLFGLVGAYGLRAALVGDPPAPAPGPRTVVVPLAAHELPAGRVVTQGDMALMSMTQADMQARNLPLDKTMLSPEQIIGRVLREPMKQGDGFFTTNLFLEGTGPDLAERLKPGMRAVTIPIDNLAAVGGSTIEGSYVDVLFRVKARAADAAAGTPAIPETTVTLLENVEVLSVARVNATRDRADDVIDVRTINGRGNNASGIVSVTIAVSPDQANRVRAVLGQGDLSLALRGDAIDDSAANHYGAPHDGGPHDGVPHHAVPYNAAPAIAAAPNKYTLEGVLGVAPPPAMNRVDIFRGGWSRQTVSYQNDQVVSNDMSIVPGLSPQMTMPAPQAVPAQPPVENRATQPVPNFYQGGANGAGPGMGFGGFGGGFGYQGR